MAIHDPVPSDSAGVRVVPPIVFALCLIGGIAAAWALGAWGVAGALLPMPVRVAVGGLLAVAGFGFGAWGLGLFHVRGVNPAPNRPASQLVTAGAYRFSRNPMYVGLVAILAGLGIAAGSWPILVSAVPMFLYLDSYVIAREEAYLGRTFGADYAAYCQSVRRWL